MWRMSSGSVRVLAVLEKSRLVLLCIPTVEHRTTSLQYLEGGLHESLDDLT